MANDENSKTPPGAVNLSQPDRARSADAAKFLQDNADEAEIAYRSHVALCGICEKDLKVSDIPKLHELFKLVHDRRSQRVLLHCDDGVKLWGAALRRHAIANHARTALRLIGVTT